jgi:tetratricopeptide (TPR) repeat protein
MTRRAFACCLLAQAAEPDVAAGFDHFYNLEFDQAIAIFRAASRKRPNEAAPFNHLAQAILYREMFRTGALETELVSGGNAFLRRARMNPSPSDAREFDDAIATSMRICRERLAANPDDKTSLFAMGVAHGLRANYSFLVRKAWMDALRDATASRKAHARLTEIDPNRTDAKLTQGLHEYIVAGLPWYYRTLGLLAGFRGDRVQGIKTVELVYSKGELNRDAAALLLATIYRRERRPAEAVPLLTRLAPKYPRNYLLWFELAQMHGDLGQKESALAAIDKAERGGAPIDKVRYYRGTVQFWYREFDQALANFAAVTSHADTLDPNTGVTAWLRLGQTYDVKRDRARAVDAYKRCVAYAPGSYRAKEAEALLRSPYKGH